MQTQVSTPAATDCPHNRNLGNPPARTSGCEECLRSGTRWMSLRKCLLCGHVGCCDNSVGKHATGHFHETGHAVMQSAEPGEQWKWCFVDNRYVR